MILNPTTIEEIAANREEWAAALESGKYLQATGNLRASYPAESFCCLGVGCDITEIGYWSEDTYKWLPTPDAKYPSYVSGDWDDSSVFHQAFGIDDHQEGILINANDSGMTFTEIARMIRALPLPESVTP